MLILFILFSSQQRYKNAAIRRLVDRTANGLLDNGFFAAQARIAQDTPEKSGEYKSDDVLWMVPYGKRFPDDTLKKILSATALKPFNYIGGYPPGWSNR